ncbi:hypothetical protein [Desulfosporosinus sp. OT]|uniref:hypothetical protein n=1 Tax=Desulfosporosinus sp. OT TaxID=913865 RepID=UPI000223AC37|nr:hypothetical protein [Desulfosporosinus sp. OT]EGW38947.1 hypothetical protein DOT_3122 [Desulfosporosinus sp. OT]
MEDKEVSQEFGAPAGVKKDVVNETGSLTSQMNDSIGLTGEKFRNSEVKELTLS